MIGSLYFSEIRHLEPCKFCWLERIAVFPLVFILGIAIFRNDFGIIPYALCLVSLGLILTTYHVAIEQFPALDPIDICTGSGPSCKEKLDIGLGFVSLPMLSLLSQVLILIFLLLAWRNHGNP